MRQMVGRLVTCSRRERNNFCYIVFNTTQTTDTSMKETTTLYSLHQGPPHLNHPCSAAPKILAVMPCEESLILYYSVPCTAMELSCCVSSLEPRPPFDPPRGIGGQEVPLWREIWVRVYHDSSCHCPPCTNTLCPTLSAIFPVLAAT